MKELPSALTKASLLSSAMRLKLSRASLIAFLAIYPLRAITPASIILLIACILRLRSGVAAFFRESRIRSIVFVYSLLESSFFLWFLYARKRAQKRQELDINETKEQRWELFTRIANAGLPGCRYQFVREWFYPTSLENVGREDMKRWLSWAFFDKPLEEVLADNYSEELDDMITSLENGIGFKFPDGSTDTPLILLNLDPVVAKHRPLLHYAVTSCLDLGMNVNLQIKRFRRYSYEKAKYWIRDMGKKELKPLVFIHGVGIGLATYLPFLNEINTERTIILIELAHVSMKLRLRLRHIPSMKQTVETIEGILLKHGYESALWMGHSLGTFIVACALQYRPKIVNNVILVDPVCLMLWEPRLVKNFVYRKPITPRQRIQNYHVSKELHISYYFQRHFCWRQCTLFADQLPSDSTVFLSEYDDICNHDRTLFYLQKHNIATISFSKHAHGGWILKPESRSKIVKAIDYYQ